ncbi:MAG: beta-lactamase family protein [Gorillibacterium sp.]|nr:beta-lactamase family protein [Gorillibacterium sp.]
MTTLNLNAILPASTEEKWIAWQMKNVVIFHDGLEWEWHERGRDAAHALYSCTKSILSALIGIAIEQGQLAGVELPLSSFFPRIIDDLDERKRLITIKHLLTMTSGIDWPDFDKPYWQMRKTADWIDYILRRPMAHEPGSTFSYNSGGSHLLAAILTQVSATDLLDYARNNLFAKVGISSPAWKSNQGICEGGADLFMNAKNLARMGLLYLQEGVWLGERVLSQSWIRESTKIRTKGLTHYEPKIYGQYGYHWWISPKEDNGYVDYFFAFGYGGQYLFVVPKLNIVVVIRKGLAGRNHAILSRELFHHEILKTFM